MDKANEYAVESLKQVMTLAGAVLALTITFLKDVLGDTREHAVWWGLVPSGWVCLVASIVFAWFAIVGAADELGANALNDYVFKSNRTGPRRRIRHGLSWFIPSIGSQEQNLTRKLAATAQNYFVLGLIFLAVFAAINLGSAFRKGAPPPTAATSIAGTPANVYFYFADGNTTASDKHSKHRKHKRKRYRSRS
jgi:hypothetical protein